MGLIDVNLVKINLKNEMQSDNEKPIDDFACPIYCTFNTKAINEGFIKISQTEERFHTHTAFY